VLRLTSTAVVLGAPARALVGRIGAAPGATLPGLGTRLYRLQHAGAVSVCTVEWRRIWSGYHWMHDMQISWWASTPAPAITR
jgi:hypothetical protein